MKVKFRSLAAALLVVSGLLALSSCSLPETRGAAATSEMVASVDRIFDEVVARYRLPGMALGVIVDGQIVHTRTAGELIADSKQAVDNDTLFKIASNSKAMTTALLARLVDAGKLRWDDPVTRHLPQFKMYDPWVTEQIQVRDLLIHNAGLREGAGDLMLWPTPNRFTRADILSGLAYLKPQQSFRSQYAYDNLLYVVAGEVAAAAGGATYEELMRREVFEPLGLNRCQVGEWDRDLVGNVAQPHMRSGDGNIVIRADPRTITVDTAAAAGGIRCSLNDMLTWMLVWLSPEMRAKDGALWLSSAQRDALWSAHTPMPLGQRQRSWDGSHINAYGYGWRLSDVDGVWRVAHTGTLAGMYSALNLFPDKRSGFVFMINGEGSQARIVLNSALAKLITAPHKLRTVASYADELAGARTDSSVSRVPDTSSRMPVAFASIESWLGIYRDPWFGEVSICPRDGAVVFASMKSPQLTGQVMQVGPRLLVDWSQDDIDTEAWLVFTRDSLPSTPGTATLTMSKVDPDADFSYDFEDLAFTRTGECPVPSLAESVDMQTRVDQLMNRYDGMSPGASLLVVRDGQALVRRAYGLANLEEQTVATPATNYRLASVTKQFTAAAILLLAEDGKLSLDDSLREWFPGLPEVAANMTLRQVLTHTSGLIDYEDVIPPAMTGQLHDADVLSILETHNRTYFTPGTAYRYSNSGYALLALIVGKASGQGFARFLRERIFVPLGMTDTVAFEQGISTVNRRAFGYSEQNGRWTRTDQSQTSAVLGDGGIYSSIDDLAQWDAALYDDRLLSARSRQLAFTPATDSDDPSIRYGMGWRVTEEQIGGRTLWHSGETIGFRNVIVRYPEQRFTVVLLTNRNDPEPYQTAREIAQLFLK